MAILSTRNLTKIYGGSHIALSGLNLDVEPGVVLGLLGPNGAGKTTALKLLLGLHVPTAGHCEVFGKRVTPNAADIRRRIGFLPTNPRFPPGMTPISYLDFMGKLSGLSAETRQSRLAGLIRAVDLLPASSQKIKGFSTGMLTRLGIAASLMNAPELLIWDEPTAGLDPEGRRHTIDLIRDLRKDKTIVVSSHILSDIEAVCSHVAVLHEGQLIFYGTLQELKLRLQRDTVVFELSADQEGLQELAGKIEAQPTVGECEMDGCRISVTFCSDDPFAESVASVLHLIAANGTQLIAIKCATDQTEDAFFELLKEDEGRGFTRSY
ncbi:MAG: ABC transporter ATP-binding protein [Lentisphaerae bacterium]|jgi:ABC-2 type transport system ATP-binding protein|nr:ABC transporter ATP-binding protein [Lentisphaerota bacterium]MBT4822503.1 ABC transporter ATP-binding protein [Lentisphaerota bacterium]MBT5606041.1 ABC transporter ATP-binding protein [Lentisphaerota bacterium]MBT7058570.1 ABC transporter ATP-binding protein [Lentisphaerota bacterium]MBT7845480.1 ABC transporter ATP-binding protein [Lentisphaerota bacterium]